jgi:hypothetical protein
MTEKEKLLNQLFDDPKRKHMDIKFLRGTDVPTGVEGEELLCAQANRAIARLENGDLKASSSFEESFEQVDLRA